MMELERIVGGMPEARRAPRGAASLTARRICLVTAEFHGLFKNGGIGTANTGLALELAASGHDVVVAFVDTASTESARATLDIAELTRRYAKLGITLEFVRRHPLLAAGADDMGFSYSVFAYLQANRFDVVFFNECGGQGYFALTAKHTGMFRDPPLMIVVTHGPVEWVHDLNAQLFTNSRAIAMSYLERRSVELADVLISPSRYLVDWMTTRGWKLPPQVHIIQNILPTAEEHPAPAAAKAQIREIVFFGRLETRKGLPIFCEAMAMLGAERDLSCISVTFMGKFARVDSLHSGVYILEKTLGWKTAPRIIANFDQIQALEYMSKSGVLAVMPSPAENSPCVVAECILAGIPFLASRGGGTGELIAEEDRERCLFEPTAAALRDKIAEALDHGHRPARMAIPPSETKADYRALLARATVDADPPETGYAASRVSICLVVDAASGISDAVSRALRAQTYEDHEIIVVEHGSARPSGRADDAEGSRVRRFHADTTNRAEARNLAAERATGDLLLFLDEDSVVMRPECLAAFVAIQRRCGADIVAGVPLEFSRVGDPVEGWDGEFANLPIGAGKELAIFENCLCRSIFLITRSRFKQLGGFERDVERRIEDRLLITRALLAGASLEVAPLPVYWLRVAEAGRVESAQDQRRILRAFEGEPIATVARALEGMLAAGVQGRDRALAQLTGMDGPSKDLAVRMTFSAAPTGNETFKPFVEYALRRGRYREAVEFARFADPVGLSPLAESAARAAMEGTGKRANRDFRAAETYRVNISSDVAERLRSVSSLREEEIERGPDIIAAYASPFAIAVLKAPAVCPPGTRRLEIEISAEGGDGRATEFSVCACEPGARMRFVRGELVAPGAAPWSGWRSVADARVVLNVPDRLDGALDIFLISRRSNDGSRAERIVWRSVRVEATSVENTTASVIAPDETAARLPFPLLRDAELLTDASDFPYSVFVPGFPAMHHPLAGRAAVVRIRDAIFPGATGARAVFSVDHEQSRPVQFGFWIRPSSAPASDIDGLADSLGFSGWTTARVPFETRDAAIALASPVKETMDLYLATRVVEFPDVSCCHAYWRDISVVERLAATAEESR
jgi:glycosyltransferase involved in cell wall biosynthesis